MSTPPQPGWYPDPAKPSGDRYWDGKRWRKADPAVKAPDRRRLLGGVVVVVTVLWLAGHCGGRSETKNPVEQPASSSTTAAAPTSTTHDKRVDAVPKVDGIYRVSDGGPFSTGIMSGLIGTPGPRPGSRACTWARLSEPELTILNTIDTGTVRDVAEGPVLVRIDPTDVAFSSHGCQPWHKMKER